MSKATRFLIWLTACLTVAALFLFAVDVFMTSQAQQKLIRSKADQIDALRQRASEAGVRADRAATRADDVTRVALAGIQTIACAQYRSLEVTSAFARLVYLSPGATPEQRAVVAPFVTVPPAPKGCPTKPRRKP